jgi:S-adenosylmethionine uptake transporter
MPNTPLNNTRGAVLSLMAFALYATHDVVVKFLGGDYSPIQIIFFGGLFSFPMLTVLMVGDRTDGHLRPRHPWWLMARAISGVATAVAGFYAFTVLPMAQTYAILFAGPLLITLLAIPMLGEKVGLRRGMAVVVGLLGVLIVLRPGGGAALGLGHLAALSAAVTGALASIIVRKIGGEERPVVMQLYPMLVSVVAMGCALPWVYKPMPVEHLGLLLVFSLLGFIATAVIIAAYRTGEAVIVAPMQYSQIIWAVLYGAMFFDERPDMMTGIGSAVIIASGIYIVLREGTGQVSQNRPVSGYKSRPETGYLPRLITRMRGEAGVANGGPKQ